MTLISEEIEATTAAGPMRVFVARPAEGTPPTVLMFMDAPGFRNALYVFANKLADAGFQVVVPDLYHRDGPDHGFEPEAVAADPALRPEMMRLLGSLTDDGIQADGIDALKAAGTDSGTPIAVIGFCLGARAVHRAMQRGEHNVVAGAMWHPSFLADDGEDSPHLTASAVAPLYIGVGEQDKMQSIEMHQPYFDVIKEMEHVTLKTFANADHGFSWPDHATYDEEAATASFEHTVALFSSAFGS